MPRKRRVHVPGALYHAVLRGNHRQTIFHGSGDFLAFEDILTEAVERYGARLHAYCWMPNHAHLALQVDVAPIGGVMRLLASRYARSKQRGVPTTGHLFERRYRARLVDTDRYLLALVRYIHQNPVRAGIVSDAADYRWSSHCAYLGLERKSWLTTGLAMRLLGVDARDAQRRYRALMGREVDDEEERAIRVAAPRERKGCASPPRGVAPRAPAPTLEEIIAAVAVEYGVPADSIATPLRCAMLSRARAEIVRRALRTGAANLTQVAARLGRAPSTLSELLRLRCR